MSGILRDIRYSVRSLTRKPGLTLALLFTIALGLGSNVTVRGFRRGLTARGSPMAAHGAIVSLFRRDRYRGPGPVSYEDYLSLKRRIGLFQWLGAARVSHRVIGIAGQSAIVTVAEVDRNLAGLFQLSLNGGVVVSHRMTNVRGERIRIADANVRVEDVAPEWLEGVYSDRPVDLWLPLSEKPPEGPARTIPDLWLVAGLRPGVSTRQLKNALRGAQIEVLPYTGVTPEMAESLSRVGALLEAAAGFVFFIAAANVAALLLARATACARETSVKVALGATRGRLARTVILDSTVIATAGCALSALLSVWTSRIVPALLFEQDAELLVLAPQVLSIVAACAAGAGIIIASGLLPLFEIRHDRPAEILGRERAGPSRITRTVRACLVMAQMAGCCLLVIGTGYLYVSFRAALQSGIRHRLGQPIVATVQARPDVNVDLNYFRDVEQAVRSLSGVTGMAWAARLPGSQPAWQSFRIDPFGLPLREVKMDVDVFTSKSLALFSLPPRSGRLFGFRDQTCQVAVVNGEAAAALFGDDTVGRAIYGPAGEPTDIIGVVALRKTGLAKGRRPAIYYSDTNQAMSALRRVTRVTFTAPMASRLKTAELDANVVSPGYFALMGLSLAAGRGFGDNSSANGCRRVAVVNQEAADLFFGGKPVGSAVIDEIGQRTEIAGVVRSTRLGAFARAAEPAIYFPMVQDCLPTMTLIIGTRAASGRMLAAVRHRVELAPGRGSAMPVVKTLETFLSQTALAPLHIATALVGTCATIALLLGVFGLYSTLNDTVLARRRDLAIRIALGARRRHVIWQLLREGGQLAGAGTVVGVLGSVILSQLVFQLAPGAGAPRLWVWVAGPLVLAAAVTVASVLPARRSLMTDPLHVLGREN